MTEMKTITISTKNKPTLQKECLYEYKNLPIGGGGFVTGILYHPLVENLVYLRTDIGGVYRKTNDKTIWQALAKKTTHIEPSLTYPLSIAVNSFDRSKISRLYVACGNAQESYFAVSYDFGDTFEMREIPAKINGNAPGRASGERLLVTREGIYFGSQGDGLLFSEDEGRSWRKIDVCGEQHISFLYELKSGAILVGTNGENGYIADRHERGASLYISYDKARNFEPIGVQPTAKAAENIECTGFVATRAAADENHVFVIYNQSGRPHFKPFSAYACDSGSISDGYIYRYEIVDGKVVGGTDVSPDFEVLYSPFAGCKGFGFGGIDLKGDVLIASTVCFYVDYFFISRDGGDSWAPILHGLDYGEFDWRVPYMKPENNEGRSIIHWASDLKINPHHPDSLLFNTGTGVFATDSLTAEKPLWFSDNEGIEETVHLNVYAPPCGRAKVIDIIGDLGGFIFTNTSDMPKNTFANDENKRYITCMNADYCDNDGNVIVATPRGNWINTSQGGIILSRDGGKNWKRLPMPTGISAALDQQLKTIEKPNINSGWTAISADGGTIIYCVAERYWLPLDFVVRTENEGETWEKVHIYNKEGGELLDHQRHFKIMSDRLQPNIFYGFDDKAHAYISRDGGKRFDEVAFEGEALPEVDCGLIDGGCKVEITVKKLCSHNLLISTQTGELLSVTFSKNSAAATALTPQDSIVFAHGLGMPLSDSKNNCETIFAVAIINGQYGFWRSANNGENWVRINTDQQMYGRIKSICGDYRTPGVFYLATGTLGLVVGKPTSD